MEVKTRVGRHEVKVEENLLDRVVRYIDPVAAARRMASRLRIAAATTSYKGASKSRRSLGGYSPGGGSADADLLPELPDLRDRSRELVRNSPLAGGAINTVVTSVIGTGLMLQSQIDAEALGMSDEEAAAWQRQAEREFRLWGESPECDASRTQDFYELQDLVFRSALESGDVFALTPQIMRPGSPYGLKLQIIEADRIGNPMGKPETALLAGGVERDTYGAPVAYHVFKEHPGSIHRRSSSADRVLAYGAKTGRRQVLHLFKRLRPGQTRGEPYLAPVVDTLKQTERYTDAEIFAAVLSSFIAIQTESKDGSGISPLESVTTGVTPPSTGDVRPSSWDGELSPGLMVDLAEGEKLSSPTPGRPNTAFEPFMEAILRQVGVRLELPFEVLTKSFTSSYSASRASLLEAWRFFKVRRVWMATKFCQPVYELFLDEAIARGRLAAPGFFTDPVVRAAYLGAVWNGDGAGSIDPMKEVQAVEKRVEMGLTTLKKETAEYDGGDWEQNQKQREKEVAARKKAGLGALPSPQVFAGKQDEPSSPPAPAPDEDNGDAEDETKTTGDRTMSVTVQPPVITVQPPAVNVLVQLPPPPPMKPMKRTSRTRPIAYDDDGRIKETETTEIESYVNEDPAA